MYNNKQIIALAAKIILLFARKRAVFTFLKLLFCQLLSLVLLTGSYPQHIPSPLAFHQTRRSHSFQLKGEFLHIWSFTGRLMKGEH